MPTVSRARSVRTGKLSPDIFESVKTRAISVFLGSLDFTHSFRRDVKGFRKPVKQAPFAVADNTVFFQTSFVLVEKILSPQWQREYFKWPGIGIVKRYEQK